MCRLINTPSGNIRRPPGTSLFLHVQFRTGPVFLALNPGRKSSIGYSFRRHILATDLDFYSLDLISRPGERRIVDGRRGLIKRDQAAEHRCG